MWICCITVWILGFVNLPIKTVEIRLIIVGIQFTIVMAECIYALYKLNKMRKELEKWDMNK